MPVVAEPSNVVAQRADVCALLHDECFQPANHPAQVFRMTLVGIDVVGIDVEADLQVRLPGPAL